MALSNGILAHDFLKDSINEIKGNSNKVLLSQTKASHFNMACKFWGENHVDTTDTRYFQWNYRILFTHLSMRFLLKKYLYNPGQKTLGHLSNFGRKVENLLYMLPSLYEQRVFFFRCLFRGPPCPQTMLKHASDRWTDLAFGDREKSTLSWGEGEKRELSHQFWSGLTEKRISW